MQLLAKFAMIIPPRMMVAESEDGLLFSTVQVYSPPVVTVRVCVYCAVSGSSNTVSVPSVTVVVESLVQVTVVAGPPVEIQVRVSWSESNVTSSPIIVMSPMLCFHKVLYPCISNCCFTVQKSIGGKDTLICLPPSLVYSPT